MTIGSPEAVAKYKDFFSLKSLVSPERRPVICTLVGEGGMGKTSLAALFPSPVIIRVEDGTSSVPGIAAGPKVGSIDDVFEQIETLGKSNHQFKTLIIDSISAFDLMAVTKVQKENNTKNLAKAAGGFGGGYEEVRTCHIKLKDYCDRLAEKFGMAVIYIAHTTVSAESPPDSDAFTKYTIQCTRTKSIDCSEVYTKDADIIAFIKQDAYIKTDDETGRKRAIGTGDDRIVMCGLSPAHVSKNRFGISGELQFTKGQNPLLSLIPFYQSQGVK